MAAGPDVLNHNIETVPGFTGRMRPGDATQRSLNCCKRVREGLARAYNKISRWFEWWGWGEGDPRSVLDVLGVLHPAPVDIVTIGPASTFSPGPQSTCRWQRFVSPEQLSRPSGLHGETEAELPAGGQLAAHPKRYHAGERCDGLMREYPANGH